MDHPYLVFALSSVCKWKLSVGTSNSTHGNALSNSNAKIIEIPEFFNDIEVAEIGLNSFYSTKITSVFIPKSIIQISQSSFDTCVQLTEVRFEKGSKLQTIGYSAFWGCTSLKRIDFPKVSTILTYSSYIFLHKVPLDCFSYAGSKDFSSLPYFFDLAVKEIYVSNDYPASEFASRSITGRGKTCGVSQEHFEPVQKRKIFKYSIFCKRHVFPFQNYMLLLICS